MNLGWSAALYLRFIRARSTFDRLERWQTMYLPVFSIWAVVFPLVFIDVDDLAKAEQFYCDALSLSAGRRFGESGVELLGSPAPIYLLAKRSGTVASTKIYGHLGWRSTTTMMHIR